MLSREGVVLLTTPSPLHQSHLAATNPGGLQIIDEIITARELAQLALDIGATLTNLKYERVWHTNDYVQTVIERSPRYERIQRQRSVGEKLREKLPNLWHAFMAERARRARAEMVHRRLGVRLDQPFR
jgi:hypothetical protein